jgi:replicative DNA helicase
VGVKKMNKDRNAELVVLGGICRHGLDAYLDASDLINEDVFQHEETRAVWQCVEHIYKDGVERKIDTHSIVSASRTLDLESVIKQPEVLTLLKSLVNYNAERSTITAESKKLRKISIAKELVELCRDIADKLKETTGEEETSEILNNFEEPAFEYISKINSIRAEGPVLIAEGIDEILDHVESNPTENMGIPTPFPKLNWCIGGGARRGESNVLAGRQKSGKSITTDAIGLHVAEHLNIPVLNVDTEMTRKKHLFRILANLSGIEIRDIERGTYASNPENRALVRQAAERLKKMPYYYECVIDKSFDEHLSTIRRWVSKIVGVDDKGQTKDALVLYDYIQCNDESDFKNNKFNNESQILGFRINALNKLLVKCDVSSWIGVQMNRASIKEVDSASVFGSDRIGMKCASLTAIQKKDESELSEFGIDEGNLKLIPLLSRNGEPLADGDYINLKFIGRTATVIEGRTRNELLKFIKENKREEVQGFEVEDIDSEEGRELLQDRPGNDSGGTTVAGTTGKSKRKTKKTGK